MASYYVSFSLGSDLNNGLSVESPWKTLAKINSTSIVAGDIVYFKKGDTWQGESLNVTGGATINNKIRYTSYGVGEHPKFTGFRRITSWVNEGNGIYSYQSNDLPSYLRCVRVNGVLQGKGKFPNKGYLPITSNATTTSVTSSSLTAVINYSGAEIVSMILPWVIDRKIISSHTGGTLTFPAMQYVNKTNSGFFIQNHISCLNDLGDWLYNTSTKTILMYFGGTDPNTVQVDVSILANGINLERVGGNINNHKVIENIELEGYNNNGVNYIDSSDNLLSNMIVSFIGQKGFSAIPGWYLTSNNVYTNNHISHCHEQGIKADRGCVNATIENNLVEEICLDVGLSAVGELEADAISAGTDLNNSINITIRNNRVINCGYIGINAHGTNVLLENNYVEGFCKRREDGAGIYTYDAPVERGAGIWRKNICVNGGVLDLDYAPNLNARRPVTYGFYCDNQTGNYIIEDNVAANNQHGGFNLNDPRNITARRNIAYNNGFNQLSFNTSPSRNTVPTQLNFQDNIWYSNLGTQPYLDYVNNSDQSFLMLVDDHTGNFAGYGIMNNNYFLNGNNINQAVRTRIEFGNYMSRSLSQWKVASNLEINSNDRSGLDLSNSLLIFNDSLLTKSYEITGTAVDETNTSVSTEFSLEPFEFKLLIGNVSILNTDVVTEPGVAGVIVKKMKLNII